MGNHRGLPLRGDFPELPVAYIISHGRFQERQANLEKPAASVIIVNWEEPAHTVRCLQSLATKNDPPFETILVDNGSHDSSLERILRQFPAIRPVGLPDNVGFAGAANAGAHLSESNYLVFLNNDTRVEEGWLSHLIACSERRDAVCVGAKLLSWDGRRVDFAGGGINAVGHGFQNDFGVIHNPDAYIERPSAFACGGAALIRRDWFQKLGGFDDGYFAFFEDVDFGWRSWLAGGQVWFTPAATVYHRHHQTARRLPAVRRRALLERNALFNLYKNLEWSNVGPALACALSILFRRIGALESVSSEALFATGEVEGHRAGSASLAGLAAVEDFIRHLPELAKKRQAVQQLRRRSDEEIFESWNGDLSRPNLLDERYAQAQELAAKHLWPGGYRRPVKRRVLVIAHEPVAEIMTGPAIRSYEIAKALVETGEFELTLAAPETRPRDDGDLRLRGYRRDQSASVVPLLNACDSVFAFGYLAHELPELTNLDKPVALDVYDPFSLENLEIHRAEKIVTQVNADDLNSALLLNQFLVGDFYLCADERQRDFYLGMLSAAGRLNPLTRAQDPTFRRLIDVAPFGAGEIDLPAREDARAALGLTSDDFALLWNGGLWEWLDPDTLLDAFILVLDELPTARLLLPVYRDARPDLSSALATQRRIERRILNDERLAARVLLIPWTGYQRRGQQLAAADLAICLHRPTLEARYALRSRLLDCLTAGLPIICTGGGPWDDLLGSIDNGLIVPPGDPQQVKSAILRLARDAGLRDSASDRLRNSAEAFQWSKIIGPLVEFLRRGEPAADRRTAADRRQLRQRSPVSRLHTPIQGLPGRAWDTLMAGGADSLKQEVANYLRWRLGGEMT